jgi:trimethylamine-N-oxide reductase (cytochrome c)
LPRLRRGSDRAQCILTRLPPKYDPIEPGNPKSIDRGGCMNLITPGRMVSKNAPGMAPNSCLIEIKKWEV